MSHRHDILPVEDLGSTNSGGTSPVSGVDIDVDVASEPLATPGLGKESLAGSVHTADHALERWKSIQGNFVDDPRRAVLDARALVDDLVQRIVRDFTQHRESLDREWASEQTSTEQLRVCLQNYRAFFTRILPALSATTEAQPHENR